MVIMPSRIERILIIQPILLSQHFKAKTLTDNQTQTLTIVIFLTFTSQANLPRTQTKVGRSMSETSIGRMSLKTRRLC